MIAGFMNSRESVLVRSLMAGIEHNFYERELEFSLRFRKVNFCVTFYLFGYVLSFACNTLLINSIFLSEIKKKIVFNLLSLELVYTIELQVAYEFYTLIGIRLDVIFESE